MNSFQFDYKKLYTHQPPFVVTFAQLNFSSFAETRTGMLIYNKVIRFPSNSCEVRHPEDIHPKLFFEIYFASYEILVCRFLDSLKPSLWLISLTDRWDRKWTLTWCSWLLQWLHAFWCKNFLIRKFYKSYIIAVIIETCLWIIRWERQKMVFILQAIFVTQFDVLNHCISFQISSWGSDEQNVNIGLDNIFASNMHQAIILTTGVVVSWRIYAPFGFDKL